MNFPVQFRRVERFRAATRDLQGGGRLGWDQLSGVGVWDVRGVGYSRPLLAGVAETSAVFRFFFPCSISRAPFVYCDVVLGAALDGGWEGIASRFGGRWCWGGGGVV